MSFKDTIANFIRQKALDILIIVVGVILSTILGITLSGSAAAVGGGATFFVELSLLTIRKETQNSLKSLKEYIDQQLIEVLQKLQKVGLISEISSFSNIINNGINRQALDVEIVRMDDAISDLLNGKRRIYDKDSLYDEQKAIIRRSKKSIITIHIVNNIQNLYQWDPERMDKESNFYKVLYNEFNTPAIMELKAKRRVIVLPDSSVQRIKSVYGCIPEAEREALRNMEVVPADKVEQKTAINYFESIQRIVSDQKRLNFDIKFITSNEVIREQLNIPVHDCIIGDDSFGLEFAKSKTSLDVKAFVIESQEIIQKQREMFEDLWRAAKEWK